MKNIFTISICIFTLLYTCSFAHAVEQILKPAPADNKAEAVEEYSLISHDLLIASAIRAEKLALYPLQQKKDDLEKQIISSALDALTKRWQSWKLEDGEFTSALVDMMTDFAVMQRFFEPDKEFLMSFDKSVHTRANYFYRSLVSGNFKNTSAFFGMQTGLSKLDLAKLYNIMYAFEMQSSKGQLSSIIWLHLLRTEPKLQILWNHYTKLSQVLYPAIPNHWKTLQKAAFGIPLARMSDLSDPLNRVKIVNVLKAEKVFVSETRLTIFFQTSAFSHLMQPLINSGFAVTGNNLMASLVENHPDHNRIKALSKDIEALEQFAGYVKGITQNHAEDLSTYLFSRDFRNEKNYSDNRNMSLWVIDGNRVKNPSIKKMIHLSFAANTRVELAPFYYRKYAKKFAKQAEILTRAGSEYDKARQTAELWQKIFTKLASLKAETANSAIKFAPLPDIIKENSEILHMHFKKPDFIRVLSLLPESNGKPANLYLGHSLWQNQKIEAVITVPVAKAMEATQTNDNQQTAITLETTERKIQLNALRLLYNEATAEFQLDEKEILKNIQYFAPTGIKQPVLEIVIKEQKN